MECLKGKKILLATGGSGGHVSPALAVAEILKNSGAEVALSYDRRTDKLVEGVDASYLLCSLPLLKRQPGVWGKFLFFSQLVGSFFSAVRFIFSFKPDLIIGFGGYASAPMVVAAMIRGMPLVLHEQNAVLGQVNRFAARSALFVGAAFSGTKDIAPKDLYKTVFVGNPVRKSFSEEAKNEYILPTEEGPLHVMIMAGSQGARYFDFTVSEALAALPENVKKRLVVTQQARSENQLFIESLYKQHGISFTLNEYFQNIPELMKKSHLVIGRAGSSTVFELLMMGRPGVLIPLPTSKDNHQYYNAQAFQEAGAGMFFEQKELTAERLSKTLVSLLMYPHLLKRMHESALKTRQLHSAERFCKAICEALGQEKEEAL